MLGMSIWMFYGLYSNYRKLISEKGYKMKKEYIKPEAELMKFVEAEEIMLEQTTSLGTIDYQFPNIP